MELASASAVISYSNASSGTATLSTTLGSGIAVCSSIGASRGKPCSLDAVLSALEGSAAAQQAIYAKYNTAAEPKAGQVRQAVEAAVMVRLALELPEPLKDTLISETACITDADGFSGI